MKNHGPHSPLSPSGLATTTLSALVQVGDTYTNGAP